MVPGRSLLIKLAMTAAAALLLAVGLWAVRLAGQPAENAELVALLAEADSLRGAADACTAALKEDEAHFREFDREVASLRAAVRAHESPGGGRRTVPAEEYAAYLELFERYNAAVPDWHAQADSLRGRWTVCRAVAEKQNAVLERAAALRYGTAAQPAPE
jgi:hypothetical protein